MADKTTCPGHGSKPKQRGPSFWKHMFLLERRNRFLSSSSAAVSPIPLLPHLLCPRCGDGSSEPTRMLRRSHRGQVVTRKKGGGR